ncbi:MAG: DnaJ domain-containing protein, partial [Paludibacteraceae bacterium]|nr:DnaJ domain-containing protein [Paludibacteraceae bacterium]
MKLFELQESDIQYLCNKFHIREPKQKKSKESDKRYTEYKNKDQRSNSSQKSKQNKQNSQNNSQQQESQTVRRQKKLEYAFAVLGLPSSASQDEIRKAYRSLALKYHPDTVQEDFLKLELTEKFKEIN